MKVMLHCDKSVRLGFGWDTIHGLWRNTRLPHLLAVLHVFLCVACTNQIEHMSRNHPTKGDSYFYMLTQWGGQGAFESSSGTRGAMNNETSFKDFVQGATMAVASVQAAKTALAAEVTKRAAAGEITKQQAQQLNFEIAKIQSDADLAKFMAALEAQP